MERYGRAGREPKGKRFAHTPLEGVVMYLMRIIAAVLTVALHRRTEL